MGEDNPTTATLHPSILERQPSPDQLVQKLDSLLEQYLELLDEYTTLREELLKAFSAGFFSLAQAQRTSTLGAGRRYGQDCYDQRMKAQRSVTVSNIKGSDQFTMHNTISYAQSENTSSFSSGTDEKTTVDIRDAEESPDAKSETVNKNKDNEEKDVLKKNRTPDAASRDPITWFGILVPPALRRTQSHFIDAVEGVVPKLLSAQAQMQAAEKEIEALREQLTELAEVQDSSSEESEPLKQAQEQLQDVSTGQEQRKADSRRKLTSRPAHSKAPLLHING